MHNHPVKFHGKGGEFFGIWIVNLLLSIITLGIYSAWAKVRNNRYLYGNTELDGGRFEYTATPIQILVGRLIAVAAVGLWYFASSYDQRLSIFLLVIGVIIFPVLIANSIRFGLRMTRYRNVHFGFNADYQGAYINFLMKPMGMYAAFFALIMLSSFLLALSPIAGSVAMLLSFIAMVPLFAWVTIGSARYVASNIFYGNLTFSTSIEYADYAKITAMAAIIAVAGYIFSSLFLLLTVDFAALMGLMSSDDPDAVMGVFSTGGAVFGFVMLYVGMVITGVVTAAFFQANIRNYLYENTVIDGDIALKSNMNTFSFIKLLLSNMLLLIFTAGLATPFVTIRTSRFLADATEVIGDLTLADAKNTDKSVENSLGEEMAEAFDLDIGAI